MDFFDPLFNSFDTTTLALAAAIMFCAGFVKGAVGFALPMVAVSGIGSLVAAPVAVAAILMPALLTNVWQALRDGRAEAVASLLKFKYFTTGIVIVMGLTAPLVSILNAENLFLILGGGVTFFAILQLLGLKPSTRFAKSRFAGVLAAGVAGFFGGLAGVTGPAVVMYLLACGVQKAEQVRVQGLIFGLGLAVITLVHGSTGVLNELTWPLSIFLIIPAFLGMGVGLLVQDRLAQDAFRKAVLVVLIFAGLNLLRRGLMT